MMKLASLKIALSGALLMTLASSANAAYLTATEYTVKNTGEKDCTNTATTTATRSHGLYTGNDLNTGECQPNRHFGFWKNQSTFTKYENSDTGTWAVLDAKASNASGWVAKIDVTFSDFDDTSRGKDVKLDNGATELDSWEFYHAFEGTISIWHSNNDKFDHIVDQGYNKKIPLNFDISYDSTKPAMQVGIGANDKDMDFGGSTWIDARSLQNANPIDGLFGQALISNGIYDWDLNMSFVEPVITTTNVPTPASLGIFALSLIGVAFSRKRKALKYQLNIVELKLY